MEYTKELKIYNQYIENIDKEIERLKELKKEQQIKKEELLTTIEKSMLEKGIEAKTEGNMKLEIKVSKPFNKEAFIEKFNPESDEYKVFCDKVEHEAIPAWTEYKFRVANVKKIAPELHAQFVEESKILKVKELENVEAK